MRRVLLVLMLLLASGLAQSQPATQPATELDRAFAALRAAPDVQGALMAEAAIRQLWSRQASPAVVLLLNRGVRNLTTAQPGEALEDFDAALVLAPAFAEAWHFRAQAQAAVGDALAAAADLRECLRLEPRHFPALGTLARLQAEAGDFAGALRSQASVLEINPRQPDGEARLREWRRRAEGDEM